MGAGKPAAELILTLSHETGKVALGHSLCLQDVIDAVGYDNRHFHLHLHLGEMVLRISSMVLFVFIVEERE